MVGSALIGQEFKDDKYFHGRPSATSAPDPADATKTVPAPYNAANSGGSNLGPTSKALNDRIKEDVDKLKAENPSAWSRSISSPRRPAASIPISRRRAPCSRCRVSPRRGICRKIASASWSRSNTEGRLAGLLGEPRVNVLALNLALDRCGSEIAPARLDDGLRTILPYGKSAPRSATTSLAGGAAGSRPARGQVAPASSRFSSAPRPASARPTRCCRARTPS